MNLPELHYLIQVALLVASLFIFQPFSCDLLHGIG